MGYGYYRIQGVWREDVFITCPGDLYNGEIITYTVGSRPTYSFCFADPDGHIWEIAQVL